MSNPFSFRQRIFALILPAFFLFLLLQTSIYSMAQQKAITGKVVNAKDETPLPGATVSIKGTKNGTSTNNKGEFSLSVKENETLVISAVGFNNYEVRIDKKTVLQISLQEISKEMEAVVVTALGISRQQKALGYAQQQIKSEELTDARSNNWSSALSGKVAGLQMLSSGSGPVNSAKITLRGDVSLNPNNNNALIVLDGVPMSNKNMTSSGVNNAYGAGSGNDVPIDFGNKIEDFNPDDI